MPRNKEFDYQDKLKVARDLFWKKGYQATTMNDLVDALAINRSSIYDSFGNKHDLFLKCLHDYIQEIELNYQDSANKGGSALESAIIIIKDVVKTILIDTKTCLAINSTFELSRIDEDVNRMLKQQANNSIKLFEDLFLKAQQEGDLSAGKDPNLLAYFVVTSFASLWNADLLFNDKKRLYQLTDFLISVIKA
ncbi:TetR/AcrR family transcriptional regulator [Mucilaginibacter aquariorum]|uniref:TetR/AcrR family transcriptional regulator n=1 Tax=Mucilaginibacter aquariorum TaxID=2967225 RepID=A0ABT1T949_9SPHI|nr:TetR/AcrR family transcriptional regulator [Mucilaginibacter aquariorum]MCQ6961143.1 TetR/AcrR family transcriptional regulator [Mucilaginibacter aquariorum]